MTRISLHELMLDDYEDTERVEAGNEKKRIKKSFSTLTFLARFDGFKINRYCSIPIEGAKKLTLKQFIRYVHEKVERNLRHMTDVRIFYTDEENDDIFVGSDDEYKELLKVAAMKNKEGYPLVVNFLGQAKRNSISKKEKKSDLLGRDSRTSPGKVMKSMTKSSVTKLRNKNVLGLKTPASDYDSEVKAISDIAEKVMSKMNDFPKIEGRKRIPSSPSNHEILKQEASVFDWMTTEGKIKEDSPPAWFLDYMDNFKEELVSEVTAKVVHSLGVVIDNKLNGLENKKTSEQKQQVKVSTKKVKKPRDSEKVKKEAIRMTMEINDEAESKELKKLKKSLIKKTDKVVKIAMKIEKKQNQEDRCRKPSLTNASTDVGINFPTKKEQKQKTKKRKTKKTKEEVNYPVSVLPDYPLVPVKDYPLIKSENHNRNLIDQIMAKHCEATDAKKQSFEKILQKIGVPTIEVAKPRGELVNAVFVSDNENIWKAEAGSEVKIRVGVTNMSCLEWEDNISVQHIISCQQLICTENVKSLSSLRPGEEENIEFTFTAPSEPGLYESVWHIFDNNQQFGPPLIFKIIVPCDDNADATELKDFGHSGVEMKSLGSSATSQEMVVINKIVDVEDSEDETQDENESENEDKDGEDEFDLLAAEVDSLALNSKKDDDFEVIPVPDCFNLDVPFEIVTNNKNGVEEEDEEEDLHDYVYEEREQDEKSPVTALEELASVGLVSVGQTNIAEIVDKLEELESRAKPNIKVVTELPQHVERLVQLGFANREENRKLLQHHGNDIEKVLERIYKDRCGDWASARH